MKVTLIVVEGAKPARVPLQLPTTIGRSERAKLKLRASLVSRTHCELYQDGKDLRVRDLGSSNGTKVNGERILAPTAINTDDLIQIGPVVLRVLCDKASSLADTDPSDAPTGLTPVASPESPATGASDSGFVEADPEDQFQLEKPAGSDEAGQIPVADDADSGSDKPTDSDASASDDEDVILAEAVLEPDESSEPPVVVTYAEGDEGSVIHIEEAADFLRTLGSDDPQVGESALEDLHEIEPDRVESGDSKLDNFFDNLD